MKPSLTVRLVLVTAPSRKIARQLSGAALAARLVACANLFPAVESHYRWKGKLESANEVLLVMKTTSRRLAALERLILEQHPYDTPEFLVLRVTAGSRRYLDWVASSVAQRRGPNSLRSAAVSTLRRR